MERELDSEFHRAGWVENEKVWKMRRGDNEQDKATALVEYDCGGEEGDGGGGERCRRRLRSFCTPLCCSGIWQRRTEAAGVAPSSFTGKGMPQA